MLAGRAGRVDGVGTAYSAGLAVAALLLFWQAGRVDLDDPADCLAAFRSNTVFGWIVLAAIVAGGFAPLTPRPFPFTMR